MTTPAYAQKMARYNQWQNESIYGAAQTLDDAGRRKDRGGFFKSIQATLSHVMWADQIWMSRLADWSPPDADIKGSVAFFDDWSDLAARRRNADADIIAWADRTGPHDFDGDLSWYSGAVGADLTRPRWVCILQLFNHQTHHRGQVHAMLTAAGAKPDDTDVPFMPSDYD